MGWLEVPIDAGETTSSWSPSRALPFICPGLDVVAINHVGVELVLPLGVRRLPLISKRFPCCLVCDSVWLQ